MKDPLKEDIVKACRLPNMNHIGIYVCKDKSMIAYDAKTGIPLASITMKESEEKPWGGWIIREAQGQKLALGDLIASVGWADGGW